MALTEKKLFKIYIILSIYIISTAVTLGALGAYFDNKVLSLLHPYIFFIGFGNLSILILNRFLTNSIYPQLKINPKTKIIYIINILISLVLITLAITFEMPVFKTIVGLMLMASSSHAIYEIFKSLSIAEIWKDISARYYIFDVIFLLNAALGLFVLGLKEQFPNLSLIPFFIQESSYFLGSSFPLSISTMGFIYAYSIRNKEGKVKKFFDYWFYIFVGGVVTFLILILMELYWGMMISSNLLIFGVLIIFFIVLKFLMKFYKEKFKHPTFLFLILGITSLLYTGVFGVFNIHYMEGREFGTRLADAQMWMYKSHTHAALMGWIVLSFLGMIYAVYPSIQKNNSTEKLQEGLKKMLSDKQRKLAFIQLFVAFFALGMIEVGFYYDNNLTLLISGLAFSSAISFTVINLVKGKEY